MSAKISGPQKTAMLLMALGEEGSAPLLKFMTDEEIKQVGVHMTAITNIKRETVDELLSSFIAAMGEESDLMVQGKSFIEGLLPSVLGKDAGKLLLNRIELEREKMPFKYIQDIDSKVLSNFIKGEHPQTITIIMAHLARDKASQVLHHLPENLQYEVVERIAQLEIVPPDLVKEVDEVLEKELLSMGKEHRVLGGVQAVAEILNVCDKRTGEGILQQMEERDAELAEKVRKLMFVFDDLVSINDLGIRELLKEVSNDELILALKTGSDELKEKIFKNLSKRAGEMLQEDMAVMGPVRLSDVEAAQQNILAIARKLEKDGRIILAGTEGGDTLV